jgi:hypothetical protein
MAIVPGPVLPDAAHVLAREVVAHAGGRERLTRTFEDERRAGEIAWFDSFDVVIRDARVSNDEWAALRDARQEIRGHPWKLFLNRSELLATPATPERRPMGRQVPQPWAEVVARATDT